MSPQRIQRRRTAGSRMPPGAVYVGRPSRWGNPVQVGPGIDRAEAVRRYQEVLAGDPHLIELARTELAGRDLACWCPLVDGAGRPVPCHADVLLHVSNGGDLEDR